MSKANKKLPQDPTGTGKCFTCPAEKYAFDTGYFTAQQDMLDAGYHQVKPVHFEGIKSMSPLYGKGRRSLKEWPIIKGGE